MVLLYLDYKSIANFSLKGIQNLNTQVFWHIPKKIFHPIE